MEDVNDIVTFLELIVGFWKILNINGPYDHVRFRNSLKCPIRSTESTSLNDLTVCNFRSMKSPVELNSLLSKFFSYITWFVISPD